ncbi:DUF3626 domain-containing protein [Desertihabitans brevis]|uniref:DUF3626 domain-containing protein n=1 Tax=Desertihabitans brevis TaxID=2268447 RepID=A0A367YUE8_9ACTN|nr:DUF3626 domain-containing protein [Desertihabitans brevis]RCK69484.1 DUF3626 domain-containing protein [Desertihabitans brevis]
MTEVPAWRRALAHVEERSSGPALDRSLRVTVHFHPDRLVAGLPLLAVLARTGRYRSQFETGTSNGGLTAHPGGDRWRWEQRMFGHAYDDAAPSERPVYGSLDHRRRDVGGSVRFGSAHLVLAEAVLDRTTFCWPDSTFEPVDFGTARRMRLSELADAADVDRLDDYVEAHVHGQLLLDRDVEAVVLDPSYRGTEVEAAATGLPVPVRWHSGLRLSVDELTRRADYRGSEVVRVGREVAEDGWLDARLVGRAAARGRHDPQLLKRLWHCVARFGGPAG